MKKRDILHYIWKYRMVAHDKLYTPSGKNIEILNIGEEDGNIFRNGCVRIDGCEREGSILVEPAESDGNAALCIVSPESPFPTDPDATLVIEPGKHFEDEFLAIICGKRPCEETINATDTLHTNSYLSRLLIERIEEKARRITATHNLSDKRWEETLFRTLARNFGFGIQGEAFEQWASILDLTALGKHRDNLMQIEAVFFGQAGLLETESIPEYYRVEAERTPYYTELRKEYRFLATKFNLQQVDHKIWGGSGTPHLRIARLAAMYHKGNVTLSGIAECDTLDELKRLLQTPIGGYWSNRTHFGGTTTTAKPESISTKHLHLLIINTIVPILYSYGKHRKDNNLCNKAEDHLHLLPPEDNGIIRTWEKMGLHANCAADSQALIQLKKEYCNKKRCLDCQFAYRHLKSLLGK